ncbi:extracellular catalytic domain type 1 short-chain-length polyhydroxyalkanoate depolymerase [Nocardiopsis halotolerans]|uniref:extracellular catalytic domain type 1 short-chain-length polyhydroxyalkanoate depolymerase n=1 Tax=Nocardiopsis halotolerans TaxID=124252 RepID=UPI00034C6456|nr:PHB depolymerase family esterase [Nocardiopsis halotolerans]
MDPTSPSARRHLPPPTALPLAVALTAVLAMVTALLVALAPRASAATLTPVSSFGANPGNLAMYSYVPDGLPADAPLVVLLHGCAQDASAYHGHSGWAGYADEHGFALVYPEQKSANNAISCFNWFQPGDTARDSGEARSIRSMVEYAVATHGLAADQVYVSGLSAGGAMAGELLAAYPDLFAGGSIVAGIPVGCASGMIDAFTCMNPGRTRTPQQWGDEVRDGNPGWDGPWPRVAVWHGTADTTVAPANGDASVSQWTNVHGLSGDPDATEQLSGSTTAAYHGGDATTASVAHYTVSGMGHGTPVDPSEGCGTAGAYFLDTVCSTGYTVDFWGIGDGGQDPGPDPTDPPTEEPTDPPTEEPGVCVTDSNYDHVSAGRAVQRSGRVYAVGSGDALGLWNVFVTTSLTETSPGYWEHTPNGC